MARSKYHLETKTGHRRFQEGKLDAEQRAKRVKRQRRQGKVNSAWLRTRHRIRKKVLR